MTDTLRGIPIEIVDAGTVVGFRTLKNGVREMLIVTESSAVACTDVIYMTRNNWSELKKWVVANSAS